MSGFARFLSSLCSGCLILFSSFSSALSQASLIYQKNGADTTAGFGFSIASAGDVDGDGKADFIVGAPQSGTPYTSAGTGSVFVYSGATGILLHQKNGSVLFDNFGHSVAGAGDVNGDGKADFIVGAPFAAPAGVEQAGAVYLYSGGTGSLLFQKNGIDPFDWFGLTVAGVGDVNGDGRADFIVGAPLADPGGVVNAGSIFVYSGATGTLLYRKDGAAFLDNFGRSVAGAGDIDGDGRADFIVGALLADPGGVEAAGSAFVYSGATGSLLYQKDGADSVDLFGRSVAGAGDMDGDGRADFIVGAPDANPGGVRDAGTAYVYSGATGDLLFQKNGTDSADLFGFSVAGAGDVDGDGKADFIIGALLADPGGLTDAGSAYVFSGATGALLFSVNGTAPLDELGHQVASAGDVQGDGKAEVIVGAPETDPEGIIDAGSAFVYGFCVLRGDVDNSGVADIIDIVGLVRNVVFGDPLPNTVAGDTDCNGIWDISDLVLLVQYVAFGTPTPCCL